MKDNTDTNSLNVDITQVTTWNRALNAARKTVGKPATDKLPSSKWKLSMLLAEHSPIRLVEYDIDINNIMQWVTTHLVRHKNGIEHFVHTQREDRNNEVVNRNELPQGALNDMQESANAQALINISRKRLCTCASSETREAWKAVKQAVTQIDPELGACMVPDCIYRGACMELHSCGYAKTRAFVEALKEYRKTVAEQNLPIV